MPRLQCESHSISGNRTERKRMYTRERPSTFGARHTRHRGGASPTRRLLKRCYIQRGTTIYCKLQAKTTKRKNEHVLSYTASAVRGVKVPTLTINTGTVSRIKTERRTYVHMRTPQNIWSKAHAPPWWCKPYKETFDAMLHTARHHNLQTLHQTLEGTIRRGTEKMPARK